MDVNIRKATKEDLPVILTLIKELAEYEKAPDEVTLTLTELEEDGFGESPLYEAFVAEKDDKMIVGMAFFYFAYSTWKGKCLYLEDIIISVNYRRQGIGTQLFDAVLKKAKNVGAKRLMWQVLEWNTPAIEFYRTKYGADISEEWLNGRLTNHQIELIIKD